MPQHERAFAAWRPEALGKSSVESSDSARSDDDSCDADSWGCGSKDLVAERPREPRSSMR